MMHPLLKQVCNEHCVTEKMLNAVNKSQLVLEARKDFIVRAFRDYKLSEKEIAKALNENPKVIEYHLGQYFGRDALSPPVLTTEQAAVPVRRSPAAAACNFSWTDMIIFEGEQS